MRLFTENFVVKRAIYDINSLKLVRKCSQRMGISSKIVHILSKIQPFFGGLVFHSAILIFNFLITDSCEFIL